MIDADLDGTAGAAGESAGEERSGAGPEPSTWDAGRPGTRLLFISRKWPPAIGGMETYSVELARGLHRHFDVDEFVLPGQSDGAPPGLLRYAWFVLRACVLCLRHGRRYPSVVFGDPLLFPAALCHRLVAPAAVRLVVVYGLDLVYQRRPGLLPRLYGLFIAAFRRGQGVFRWIVAISRHTASLAEDAGLRRVVVVNPCLPGVGLGAEQPGQPRMPEAWTRATRRILYFGRLVPRKGALWFARNVMPHLDDALFLVAGGAVGSALAEELRTCDRTVCLGRVPSDQLAWMIRNADAVVMPNLDDPAVPDAEGFGLAAIEASALGGRLFASSVGGLKDAVIDGVTGVALPSGDVGAWVHALRAALADPGSAEAFRIHAADATRDAFCQDRQSAAFARLLALPPS